MTQAYFVTGTDTDAGKTTISCGLLHLARQQGLTTAAHKPVASGSELTAEGLRNRDALLLQQECHPPLAYDAVNPRAFAPAIAPHVAARECGQTLAVTDLLPPIHALHQQSADFLLVEGAGGWRVPLSGDECLSDLAIALNWPVILVVGVKLGSINHALLSAEAILRDGLKLAGWVANGIDPNMDRQRDTLDYLKQHMPAPCLGVVPHLPDARAAQVAGYLQLPRA